MFIIWWLAKLTVVQLHNRLFSNKSNKLLIYARNRWILKALSCVKKRRHKSPQSIWFRLTEILEKVKNSDRKQISLCHEEEIDYKRAGGNFLDWWKSSYLDCGDKYMTLCICQNSLNYTCKIGECYMWIIPHENW